LLGWERCVGPAHGKEKGEGLEAKGGGGEVGKCPMTSDQ
jgi:hypothetical protein